MDRGMDGWIEERMDRWIGEPWIPDLKEKLP